MAAKELEDENRRLMSHRQHRLEKMNLIVGRSIVLDAVMPYKPKGERRISGAPDASAVHQRRARVLASYVKWLIPTVAVAGAALLYFHHPSEPLRANERPVAQAAVSASAAKSLLGLNAERRGDDLLLSWSRESPAITSAVTGVLITQSGNDQRALTLSPEELRSGRLIYTPAGDHVNIRLDVVDSNGRQTRDSFSFLLPPKTDQHRALMPRSTPSAPGAPEIGSAPAPIRPAVPSNRAGIKDASGDATIVPRPGQLSGAVIRQAQPVPAVTSAILLDPPPSSEPLFDSPLPAVHELFQPVPSAKPPPHTGEDSTSVVAQAVSGSRLGHIANAVRLIKRRRQTSDFVAPTPIQPSSPEVPENLRQSLKQEVSVDVKVYVNPSGEVLYAELLSDGTGAERDIASLALFESRRWKFHPAQVGGRPSDGEVILHYRFSPEVSIAKHE